MTPACRILLRYGGEIGSGRAAAAAAFAGALSRLLLDPLDQVLAAELSAVLRGAANHEELSAPASRLACVVDTADADACRREYARLFIGPNPAPCLPFESIWTEIPPLLMGRSHRDALRFYRSAGFEPRGPSGPSDHAGVELGFVALIASRIAGGAGEGSLLESFWAHHIERWISVFGDRVAREARLTVYRTLGEVISDVTRWHEIATAPAALAAATEER